MRHRLAADESLVHVRLPGEALHIGIVAHLHEALAAFVAAIPEVLHDPENPEIFMTVRGVGYKAVP